MGSRLCTSKLGQEVNKPDCSLVSDCCRLEHSMVLEKGRRGFSQVLVSSSFLPAVLNPVGYRNWVHEKHANCSCTRQLESCTWEQSSLYLAAGVCLGSLPAWLVDIVQAFHLQGVEVTDCSSVYITDTAWSGWACGWAPRVCSHSAPSPVRDVAPVSLGHQLPPDSLVLFWSYCKTIPALSSSLLSGE